MSLALRVAARYQRQAALTEEKLKELLLKIRKGATSSLTWSQLGQVFEVLDPGWKLEKIVGLVKLYGSERDEESPEFLFGTRAEMEPKYNAYAKDAVQSLPANPKGGKLYILDMSGLEPYKGMGTRENDVQFTFKPWLGHEGWKITSPQGEVFNGLPGRFNLSGSAFYGWKAVSRTKLPTWDAVAWLKKNTDWIDQINKKLDMAPHEPAVPRTRDGTGSCPVCFQNIKLSNDAMVLHGYKRPGTGTTHGRCFGVGYKAFELSDEGCKAYLKEDLIPSLKHVEEYLRRLKSGEVRQINTTPFSTNPKYITPEDPHWEAALRKVIQSEEDRRDAIEEDVRAYEKLLQYWKVRPLPKEGERHIDWYHQGQKP